MSMTLEDLVTWFKREFVSLIEIQRLAREEYLVLEQTTKSVAKITAMFRERER